MKGKRGLWQRQRASGFLNGFEGSTDTVSRRPKVNLYEIRDYGLIQEETKG